MYSIRRQCGQNGKRNDFKTALIASCWFNQHPGHEQEENLRGKSNATTKLEMRSTTELLSTIHPT